MDGFLMEKIFQPLKAWSNACGFLYKQPHCSMPLPSNPDSLLRKNSLAGSLYNHFLNQGSVAAGPGSAAEKSTYCKRNHFQ